MRRMTMLRTSFLAVSVPAVLLAATAVVPNASATSTAAASTRTPASTGRSLAVRVSGGRLVNSAGKAVQLRGVNVSGLEFTAVEGWDAGDPWGGADPNWSAIRGWGANTVRLPLNEASWLGLKCAENPGDLTTLVNADPGGNYRATVERAVVAANAVGLRVILDLHWSAPNRNGVPLCPMTQNTMASADHAPAFWTSVAKTFKSNPSVIFELFNEPFMGEWNTTGSTSTADRIRNGGTATGFMWGYGDSSGWHGGTYVMTWKTAGMQQLLNAVRATRATNVVLVGSDSWDQQIVDSVASLPKDTLSPAQVAIAWHPYPVYTRGKPQVACVNLPSCSSVAMKAAAAAVKSGHPVVATEFGDNIASKPTTRSPWAQILLPYLDAKKISYLGWTWDTWTGYTANVLIRDSSGTPTYGFGQYVQAHLRCRAARTC